MEPRPDYYWVCIKSPDNGPVEYRYLQHSNLEILKGMAVHNYPTWSIMEWGKYISHPLNDEEKKLI